MTALQASVYDFILPVVADSHIHPTHHQYEYYDIQSFACRPYKYN